jgi:hypothetical protein
VLSSDDLSSSSVTLSESSDTDDQCELSPSPVPLSLSLSLAIGDEQADRGHTHHHQNSYDQHVQLERARVRRELLGHDQSPSHQQHHAHNHNHNQQNHAPAHHAPQQHPTVGAGGGHSSSGDETEDEQSSSGDVGSSDSDDGTDSDDGDPNIITNPNPKLNTRFPAAAIEIDPDSDTESEIDAELFFSNLIKSASSSSSSDDDDDDSEDGNGDRDADADEVMLDVEIGVEIPGAPGTRGDGNEDEDEENDDRGGGGNGNHNDKKAHRGLEDPAMMVREGWDGALVFATDIGTQGRGGVLDAAFERSSSWSRERAPSVSRMHPHARPHTHTHTSTYTGPTTVRAGRRTMSVSSGLNLPLDVIAELQAAAETTLLGTGLTPSMCLSIMGSGSALSDTEEGGAAAATGGEGGGDDETDGGETTDDELPFFPLSDMEGMSGIDMRFRLPPTAPPVLSVNPDMTMSPSTSKRANSKSEFAVGESPRPAEILQRQQMQMQRRWTMSSEGSVLTNASQALNNSTDSPENPSLPTMGVFGPPGHANGLGLSTSSKASAVIGNQTAKGSIPSPFTKLARNTGPDAGGRTPTTPSLPARGRKRRASVSVCFFFSLGLSTNASPWSLQSDLAPFFNKRSMRFPTTGVDMFSSFPPPHMYPIFSSDLFPSSPGSLFDIQPPESTPENSVIELDDVLCASVLSDDTAPTSLGGDLSESAATADGEGAGTGTGQVSRWDRVPVGLYRQMRTGNGAEEMMFSFGIGGFSAPGHHHHHHTHHHDHYHDHHHDHHHHDHSIAGPSASPGLPRAQHRPGVSLDSALWGLTNTGTPNGLFDDRFRQMLSAGILPPPMPFIGDGERATTPTPALYVPETKSRKERRKEKKKEKLRAAAAASAAATATDTAVSASASFTGGVQQDSPETPMGGAPRPSP